MLLLLQDKDYHATDNLPNYDLGKPVMVIRHSQDNQTQLAMVNRYLLSRRSSPAVPISQRFSHMPADDIFGTLKCVVFVADVERL